MKPLNEELEKGLAKPQRGAPRQTLVLCWRTISKSPIKSQPLVLKDGYSFFGSVQSGFLVFLSVLSVSVVHSAQLLQHGGTENTEKKPVLMILEHYSFQSIFTSAVLW